MATVEELRSLLAQAERKALTEENKRKAEENKRKAEENKRKAEENKRKAETNKRKAAENLVADYKKKGAFCIAGYRWSSV
jgi:colicin import membrane protein